MLWNLKHFNSPHWTWMASFFKVKNGSYSFAPLDTCQFSADQVGAAPGWQPPALPSSNSAFCHFFPCLLPSAASPGSLEGLYSVRGSVTAFQSHLKRPLLWGDESSQTYVSPSLVFYKCLFWFSSWILITLLTTSSCLPFLLNGKLPAVVRFHLLVS